MRHNDYEAIKKCKKCDKPILRPVAWSTKDTKVPTYPTCQHIETEAQ